MATVGDKLPKYGGGKVDLWREVSLSIGVFEWPTAVILSGITHARVFGSCSTFGSVQDN